MKRRRPFATDAEVLTGGTGDERGTDGLDDRLVGLAVPVNTDGVIVFAGSDLELATIAGAKLFPQFRADKPFGLIDVHDFVSCEKSAEHWRAAPCWRRLDQRGDHGIEDRINSCRAPKLHPLRGGGCDEDLGQGFRVARQGSGLG
jgi:hypothetical protein